jgi:tripartite-type tricarboxylate transporter receptor subunit TctC
VLVAAGTPRPIVDRLNAAMNAAMNDPQVRERLKAAGLDAGGRHAGAVRQADGRRGQRNGSP